jgi:hypothetical protein
VCVQVEQSVPHRKLVRALIALGAVLTVLAIFGVWADRQVLNTSDWVDTSGKLLEDQKVQSALSDYLVTELYANVDVQAGLQKKLPPRLQPIAGPLAGALRTAATQVALHAFATTQFQTAWKTANRSAHQLLLNLIDGNGRLVQANGGAVTLQLAPLVQGITQRVGISADVASKIPPNIAQLQILKSSDIKLAQDIAGLLHGLSIILAVLALLAFGLAIYLSEGRRQRTLLWSGIALIASGIFVLALRHLAGGAIVDALVRNAANRPAGDAAWSIGTSLLVGIATTVIVYGVLFAVASWLASEARSAKWVRQRMAPALRDSPWIVYGTLVVALLIYFGFAPTHGLRAILVLLLLGAFGAFGINELRKKTAAEFPNA